MSRLQVVNDLVELLEVDRGIDRTVVNFQLVLEGLEEQLVVEQVRIRQNKVRLLGQMLVQIVQPVDSVAQSE